MYQVILSFGEGSIEQGFSSIRVQLSDVHQKPIMHHRCSLPPAPDLLQLYRLWRTQYQTYYQSLGWASRIDVHEPTPVSSRFSRREFDQSCSQLPMLLNHWLLHQPFAVLEQLLRTYLSPQDQIQLILETEDTELKLLPWHRWQFVVDYSHADVALSLPWSRVPAQRIAPQKKAIKLLAVLGNPVLGVQDREIDVATDRAFLEELDPVEATFLVEPSCAKLTQYLWDQPWDILFFAGHSTNIDGQTALCLNHDEIHNTLTINEFRHALNHSVEQGLQLAIFNSCDSLGLALTLAELNIPQTIAFRDAVPDPIAHAFLKHFLAAFSTGMPTPQAVRSAREQLQAFEQNCPCASWLPVICQNPTVAPLTWQDLYDDRELFPRDRSVSIWWSVAASLLVTGGLILARTLGQLQGLELQSFDLLMQWRPAEAMDSRFLVVAIDEADLQEQRRQGMRPEGYLDDLAFKQLLDGIRSYGPAIIASDIYHDFEYEPELAPLLLNNPKFVAACEISQTEARQYSIPGPPGIPPERLGFTDLPEDPKGIIRRQLLYMDPLEVCDTEQSLSLRIASQYLKQQSNGPEPQMTPEQTLQIGDVHFEPLLPGAGGYQLSSGEAGGYQVMLNYRRATFPTVHLRDILAGREKARLSDLIPGRIILIGVVQPNVDSHPTSFGAEQRNGELPGVIIQAHMISQILSAVEDGRPLIWWWPQDVEYLWIGTWSLVGSLLMWRLRSFVVRSLSLIVFVGLLLGSCMGFLLVGGWVPLAPAMLGLFLSGGAMIGMIGYVNVKEARVRQQLAMEGRDV